jgi:hypothetical protein
MFIEIPLTLPASPFEIPPFSLLSEDDLDAADLELLPATADARVVAADLLAVHAHALVSASHAARTRRTRLMRSQGARGWWIPIR